MIGEVHSGCGHTRQLKQTSFAEKDYNAFYFLTLYFSIFATILSFCKRGSLLSLEYPLEYVFSVHYLYLTNKQLNGVYAL